MTIETIAIRQTIEHGPFTFEVRHAFVEDGEAVSAEIVTPDFAADGWDPSSKAAYPTAAILAAITAATGRRVDVIDGQMDGRSETWRLTDLGAAPRASITVEVGRHTIDPQGLASDEENEHVEECIMDAVRAAFPGADVRAVGLGGRTSGTDANGEDITPEVVRVVNEAFNEAFA